MHGENPIPVSSSRHDATGGELTFVRGRGVVDVQATDTAGRTVTLVFDCETFGDLIADAAGMWQAARYAARQPS